MSDKTYDENQMRAITASDGYYLVLAPPGCGKTDILAERIMHARMHGVEFEDMLCLTFTNRASRGMKTRVLERMGERPTAAAPMFVGNIHRYCSKYLFSESVVGESTSIIDEEDQADLFMDLDCGLFASNNKRGVNRNEIGYVSSLANYIKQRRLGHPESVWLERERFDNLYAIAEHYGFNPRMIPTDERRIKVALEYLEYKDFHDVIDFDDILILAYNHMIHHEHKRYRWIQVDEIQDLNPLQLAIVDLLTDNNPTVMYLGDEQQAIFSFMGAKLSMLNFLKQRCAGHLLSLGNNYRAPQYLLDICNDYAVAELGVDPDLLPVSVDNRPKQKMDVILTESKDLYAERNRILDMVRYYLSLDDEERLAILVSKNDEADEISKKLANEGIPNFKISGMDMFKSDSYRTLSSFYCVLCNDFNFVAWSRLLYGMGACHTSLEARKVISRLKSLKMTPSDLLYPESYLQRFKRYYDTREFVFFDTETTGLNVHEDEIVQIAAFKVRGGQKVPGSDFVVFLETDREIPAMLGDKANPLVEEYPRHEHVGRAEGLASFIDYIGDCPLLGHNVTYDYLILQSNVERELGEVVEYDVFDSLHMIKCIVPGLPMYKLGFLLEELDLEGANSHLADDDIEATKSLVDYCCKEMEDVLDAQDQFRQGARIINIASRMQILRPLFDNVRSYMHLPTTVTQRTIADEFAYMYQTMVDNNLIADLGPKFTTFLRYIESEWIDYSKSESLRDQINEHVYDITSSINEGDLVNSSELLQDRVFIMTVYKGKGLEFDNVVVLGAVDGTYPFYKVNTVLTNSSSTPKARREAQIQRAEDARKFYVAISRAKRRLCVSYSKLGIFDQYVGVTPFIESIRHHFHFGTRK